jgi:Secretion system C-terminal sorting domain/Lamin Tail Domain
MKKLLLLISFVLFLNTINGQQVFNEDFENAGLIPTGWTIEYENGTHDWVFINGGSGGSITTAHGGGYNAMFQDNSYSNYISKLVSPQFDISGSSSPNLVFWHVQQNWLTDQDTLRVYYKNSVAGSWTLLQTWANSISLWTKQIVELPNPTATYYLAFEGAQGYAYGVLVDDVVVSKTLDYNFQINKIQSQAMQLAGNDTTYLIEVTNTGLLDDTLDFNPISTNWIAEYRDKNNLVSITELPLDSGETDSFIVKLSVPPTAPLGERDTASFTLVSRGNINKTNAEFVITIAYNNTIAPYYEDFENIGVNWLVDDPGEMYYNIKINSLPIAHSGIITAYSNSGNPATLGDSTRLYAPFDLSNCIQSEFRYWIHHTNSNAANNDSVRLQYSYDGKNWTNIGPVAHRYRVDGNYWEEHIIDISSFDGDTIWLGLSAYSAGSEDTYYEDIYIGSRPSNNLIIKEIMYNPPELGQDSLEFVEIYYNSMYPLDVSGYEIGYNSISRVFSNGSIMTPYKSYIIAIDSIAFEEFYGFSPSIEWGIITEMDNNGAALWIKDKFNNLADTLSYNDSLPWSPQANGEGNSLVLCDILLDNINGSNWDYSKTYIDTIANGSSLWASPAMPDILDCNYIDIAFLSPYSAMYYCSMPNPIFDTLKIQLYNFGTNSIPIGDSIFLYYQVNASITYTDSIILTTEFLPGDTLYHSCEKTYDFSADGTYSIDYLFRTGSDINTLNNFSSVVSENFVVDIFLPGINDTLNVLSYPATIDAGNTTSSGWSYDTWYWSTTETTQTISVSADNWYYITVTTSIDSAGNQCSISDSVYVIQGLGIEQYNLTLSIYPNPNKGLFTLTIEGNTNNTILSVFNIKNQLIKEMTLKGEKSINMDLSKQPKGIYFIKTQNKTCVKMKRIIIQ